MFTAALDWAIRWRMDGLSRAGQRDSKDPALVEDVYQYFRTGITAGLSGSEGPRLTALEASVPWRRRLFFWEGYAFGLCAQHACLGRNGNPLKHFPAPGFRFMFWTGLGFWNGASKPLPTISLAPALWAGIPEFAEEYPLILGGSSFAVIAQTATVDKGRLEAIPGIRNAADLDGIYLGAGRALWFLYTRNPAKLAETLDAHPDHAQAMARGLGVAITLTQLGTPEQVLRDMAALPSIYWRELLTGSLMGFTCLLMDDARAAEPLSHFPAPLDVLIGEVQSNLAAFAGSGWTERFAEAGTRHTALWNGLQPPVAVAAMPPEPVAAQ
ncbi:MAG TPA: DUF1702 family protein [Stellaceae bacterium]|jgi:hypothetical protein|nr:DUF1702 family protein [Stellaceae bacterium]